MNLHDDFVNALNVVPANIKGGIDPYPDTKLNGAGMQSFVKQLRADTVIPRIRPVLEQYNAMELLESEELLTESWYPRQLYLDMTKELEGYMDGVAVGRGVEKTLVFPDGLLNTPMDIAPLFKGAYGLNHQDLDPNDEGYVVNVIEEGAHIQVLDVSPYDAFINYGYFFGMMNRLSDQFSSTLRMIDPQNPDSIVAQGHTGPVIFDIQYSAK